MSFKALRELLIKMIHSGEEVITKMELVIKEVIQERRRVTEGSKQ